MTTALRHTQAPATELDTPWQWELRVKADGDHGQQHPRHRGRLAVALALAAIVALLGVLARPSPPSLSTVVTGDTELAARARPLLPGALDRVSIAVVDGSAVTYAGFGADEHGLLSNVRDSGLPLIAVIQVDGTHANEPDSANT